MLSGKAIEKFHWEMIKKSQKNSYKLCKNSFDFF